MGLRKTQVAIIAVISHDLFQVKTRNNLLGTAQRLVPNADGAFPWLTYEWEALLVSLQPLRMRTVVRDFKLLRPYRDLGQSTW